MLRCIGESPVNTLSGSPSLDVANAKAVLNEISREFQTKGWSFNTDEEFTLTPDTFTKYINLPANCLRVDTSGKDEYTKVVQRGLRLYDPVNHTYEWDDPLVCDLVVLLTFDELPQYARHYLMVKACRKFQTGSVGDQLLYGFTKKDEEDAETALKDAEADQEDTNMFTGDIQLARTLKR